MILKTHQILAGGISQPERDRGGAVFAQRNRRCLTGEIDGDRKHDASVDIMGASRRNAGRNMRDAGITVLPISPAWR